MRGQQCGEEQGEVGGGNKEGMYVCQGACQAGGIAVKRVRWGKGIVMRGGGGGPPQGVAGVEAWERPAMRGHSSGEGGGEEVLGEVASGQGRAPDFGLLQTAALRRQIGAFADPMLCMTHAKYGNDKHVKFLFFLHER